jgi:hypothetical protein
MARIVAGIGTTHGSPSSATPSGWRRRAQRDRQSRELWFRGNTYAYPELLEERADEHLERELDEEKQRQRSETCQRAIAQLAETLERVAPDVCIILGDDQHESFHDDNMPSMCVYWGSSVDDAGFDSVYRREQDPAAASFANAPAEHASYTTDATLGRHLIESFMEQGFDVAHSNSLPAGRREGAIGHAFYFVYRRLMRNGIIPSVPIFLNTYYPPNQPTMRRCYQLGQALRQAVEAWPEERRVAVIASGGLSHFVIEEDLDLHVLDSLKARNSEKLLELPDIRFNSGTSEIRNWVAVGGAVEDSDLEMTLIDYAPCYRSEAGTGCAGAYAHWL